MPDPTLTKAIDALASGQDLSMEQAAGVLRVIMEGNASETQIAAFLIALRTKGETVDELAGLASTMRALATPVHSDRTDLLDTAGSGGGRTTFNVSTTAALIAAGAGCAVAKHGNRSATGRSAARPTCSRRWARASTSTPDAVARCIEQVGFGFMFAPAHHQATRYVVPVRRELAVRTIFNFLGPLTNPAGARRQVIGVSDAGFIDVIAGALARLGTDRALVVSSEDGLDEMSTLPPRTSWRSTATPSSATRSPPGDVGIDPAPEDAVAGGTPDLNARITRAILAGEPSAHADLAYLNAGAAIYAAGRADTLAEGVEAARAACTDGAAAASLEAFVGISQKLGAE